MAALLCYDGSLAARRAIETAARAIAEREAVVLAVWTPAAELTTLDPLGDTIGGLSGVYAELDTAGERGAAERAEEGARLARAAGFDARPRTAVGRAWSAIVEAADELDASVVVLGARSHSAAGALLGSVSERVARHARRPVLIVPGAS